MKHSFILIALAVFFASCEKKSTTKTPSGLEFEVLKKGEDQLPRPGQITVFNLVIKDSKDSVWLDTYERGLPERTIIGDSSKLAAEDGITQMFRMLSKGDSIRFHLTAKTFFEDFIKSPLPPHVDSTLTINYFIKVDEILNKEEFEAFSKSLLDKYYAKQEELEKEQLAKDTVAIDSFLTEKGIEAAKLPSGIRYVITKKGKGPQPLPEQQVSVNYDGYLLDGTHFDTNVESLAKQNNLYDSSRAQMGGYGPMELVIDRTSVIPGWHQALKQLSEGAKGTFYIPSTLAYGKRSTGIIKENSILIFDIEMVDIKQ